MWPTQSRPHVNRLPVRWAIQLLLLGMLIACSGAPAPLTPPLAGSFVEVRLTDVLLASGSPNFVPLDPAARQPIQDGDRVRTSDVGQGVLDLASCMRVLVFGGSNLRLERISVGNVSVDGAQLFSTICPSVTVNTDADPPVAVIQTTGTVFLAAYRPQMRMMLLWTQMGEATLSNWVDGHPGPSVTVPAGEWSVVRRGEEPMPARPIREIGPIFDEMGLWDVYGEVIRLLKTEGFGPAAPQPIQVGEVGSGPLADQTPPAILRVDVAPPNPTAEEAIAFEVEAQDEESGIARILTYVNGRLAWACDGQGDPVARCAFTVGPYAAGTVHYEVRAFNGAGASSAQPGEFSVGVPILFLRGGGGPLDNSGVEAAILRALPWQALLEEAFPGQDIPVIVEWPRWKGDARDVDYDLEVARRLMAETGYARGFELTLLYSMEDRDIAPLVKGVADHIGNLDITVIAQAVPEAKAAALVEGKIARDEPVLWLQLAISPVRPTETARPGPCPPLGDVLLRPDKGATSQVHVVVWSVTGGCAPYRGTITARYADEEEVYATTPITDPGGLLIDYPPVRCEGQFSVMYELTLRDNSGQTAEATASLPITWIC